MWNTRARRSSSSRQNFINWSRCQGVAAVCLILACCDLFLRCPRVRSNGSCGWVGGPIDRPTEGRTADGVPLVVYIVSVQQPHAGTCKCGNNNVYSSTFPTRIEGGKLQGSFDDGKRTPGFSLGLLVLLKAIDQSGGGKLFLGLHDRNPSTARLMLPSPHSRRCRHRLIDTTCTHREAY